MEHAPARRLSPCLLLSVVLTLSSLIAFACYSRHSWPNGQLISLRTLAPRLPIATHQPSLLSWVARASRHQAEQADRSEPWEERQRAAVARELKHELPHNKLWLYTSVAAHFPGAALVLQHYLDHYMGKLGFRKENFILTVNFKSSNPQHLVEYEKIQEVLRIENITYTLWPDEYSSAAHLKFKYNLFLKANMSPDDWIVVTDLDEYHDYPAKAAVFFELVDLAGFNYIAGELLDRVSETGNLTEILDQPPIGEQYPLKCHIVSGLYNGYTSKAMAYKAYLRSDRGNHYLVYPEESEGYFMADFNITPYHQYGLDKYCMTSKLHQGERCPPGTWHVRKFPKTINVMHFKWHLGEIENAKRRYDHYSGDAKHGGKPLFGWYKDSKKILQHIAEHNGLNVKDAAFNCKHTEKRGQCFY